MIRIGNKFIVKNTKSVPRMITLNEMVGAMPGTTKVVNITFNCPSCGFDIKMENGSLIGSCPKCGNKIDQNMLNFFVNMKNNPDNIRNNIMIIKCPKCDNSVDVTDKMQNEDVVVSCSKCGLEINKEIMDKVKNNTQKLEDLEIETLTKKCPYCDNDIFNDDKVCGKCGTKFGDDRPLNLDNKNNISREFTTFYFK